MEELSMAKPSRSRRMLALSALLAYPAVLLLAALGVTSLAPPRHDGAQDVIGSEVAARRSDGAEGVALRFIPVVQPLPTSDPSAPLASLLLPPPKANKAPVYVGDDLACVPELALEALPAEELTTEQWRRRKALVSAAALHLNGKEEDGFLKALLRSRPDLAGVPFVMGDACRTEGDRRAVFKEAAELRVRTHPLVVFSRRRTSRRTEVPDPGPGAEKRQPFWQAHTAVAAQVLPAESVEGQLTQLRVLASIPRPEATRALARVAVFSSEEAVRASALEALSVRRERDYTSVLVAALRYPWLAVATNAAQAIAQLDRKDMTPQLVAVLDEPDPRSPRTEKVGGIDVTVAPELVRINHLRNCLLCHAPAEPGKVPEGTLVAEVPLPSEELPDTSMGYGRSSSNLLVRELVRIDVTYLRQDFSALLEVTEKSAWPAAQRFDFVVRKRILIPAEARDLRARLARANPKGVSPYQRAAAQALRRLTGRDLGTKAQPWRRLLRTKPL
jgi:hypothetical protein